MPSGLVPATVAGQLTFAVGPLVAVYGLASLTTRVGSRRQAMFAEHVQHARRTDVYDRMQELGREFFEAAAARESE